MLVTYGPGTYLQEGKEYAGRIVLGEHRLYLSGPDGDLAVTYIPLERIVRVRKTPAGLALSVRPSLVESYEALFKGERRMLAELAKELVARRGLKKKFLLNEWVDPSPFE